MIFRLSSFSILFHIQKQTGLSNLLFIILSTVEVDTVLKRYFNLSNYIKSFNFDSKLISFLFSKTYSKKNFAVHNTRSIVVRGKSVLIQLVRASVARSWDKTKIACDKRWDGPKKWPNHLMFEAVQLSPFSEKLIRRSWVRIMTGTDFVSTIHSFK